MRPVRIIVMAKAPQPGRAKTRLIPALGRDGAAGLACQMLERTLKAARGAGLGPVELRTDPPPGGPDWHGVELPAGIETRSQGQGDLGARMALAAREALTRGERIILSGTDCAEIGPRLFQQAAQALEHADAALFPSTDGGYVLLALKAFDPTLFENIAWSTAGVARTTRARIRALGWRLHCGPTLHDIDEPADLEYWTAP